MTNRRAASRERSNNNNNPNQNICVQAVAKYFGTAESFRYLHKMSDLVTSIRKRYTVRSRGAVTGLTVGKARAKLAKNTSKENPGLLRESGKKILGYALSVCANGGGFTRHAILLDSTGATIIDTDPRILDKRKICKCYIVY